LSFGYIPLFLPCWRITSLCCLAYWRKYLELVFFLYTAEMDGVDVLSNVNLVNQLQIGTMAELIHICKYVQRYGGFNTFHCFLPPSILAMR